MTSPTISAHSLLRQPLHDTTFPTTIFLASPSPAIRGNPVYTFDVEYGSWLRHPPASSASDVLSYDIILLYLRKGQMEKSMLRDILANISHFNKLFSSNNGESRPAETFYQHIAELLTLLTPVLDEIADSDLPLDEQLKRKLEELDMFVDDAKKLMEGWHPLMSKIYNFLQIEVVAEKIQLSIQVTCVILSSLTLSAPSASNIVCIEKLKSMDKNQISSLIREVIKNQRENTLPSSEAMMKIADSLSLSSSHELLMEAVALEKAKLGAGHDGKIKEMELIDGVISLVSYMHVCLVKLRQSQTVNGVPIPPDFFCPLSLEPMSDPVIVSSGQTYERAFIQKWLALGLTVCPKTRQNLPHKNLIPNINVKALIANWCELNDVKLPDPVNLINSSKPLLLLRHEESTLTGAYLPRSPSPKDLELAKIASWVDQRSSCADSAEGYGHEQQSSQSEPHTDSAGAAVSGHISTDPLNVENGLGKEACETSSVSNENGIPDKDVPNINSGAPISVGAENNSAEGGLDNEQVCHTCASVSSIDVQADTGNVSDTSNANTNDNLDASGETKSKYPASFAPERDAGSPMRLLPLQTRKQPLRRRPADRHFAPRITSFPVLGLKSNSPEIDAQVKILVDNLQSPSQDIQRSAAVELRLLTRHNEENRIAIANSGAIKLLVDLLYSKDVETQENAVTALLNLSIIYNNKTAITNAGAIEPLIHVLKTGSPEAKENSAATLFSLSVIDEHKAKIGRSGAIQPLVELLADGAPRGKKDAATALFNLSICHENKALIVEAGAVKHLVDLMDPAVGLVDKAVPVLSNLSMIPEGRKAIGEEGGIPFLVEVVELGSSRGKENAAAALLQLCIYSPRFSDMILHQGVIPPLVLLSQTGTARAKEKAQTLLRHLRSQSRGNIRRS